MMDICSGILVAIIVIVILKMLMDSSAVHMARGAGTCGMKASVVDADAAASADPVPLNEDDHEGGEGGEETEGRPVTAAGRVVMQHSKAEGTTPPQEAYSYHSWTGKESNFSGGVKAVKEKASKGVNTRAISPDTEITQPTFARTLGVTTPILEALYQCRKSTPVQHGKACAWFGGSEAYFASRKMSGKHCSSEC